ncbi:HEAT repeat domain-containing protein [Candidatus Poribacteria bacterium]|nr:HEAT repeat domain-containing protein [Candidatus Poribacteria bacterium]
MQLKLCITAFLCLVSLMISPFESEGQDIESLIIQLGDENQAVGRDAARALGQMGEPAVPALIKALSAEDWKVRYNAINALIEMGEAAKAAVPALRQALDDQEMLVDYNAAYALYRIEKSTSNAVIYKLVQALSFLKTKAVEALVEIGEPAIPALIEGLRTDSRAEIGGVRVDLDNQARFVLGRMGPPAVPVLMEALKHHDSQVRINAAFALGTIGRPAQGAVPALIKALGDEAWIVRMAAVDALGRIGEPAKGIVPALVVALGDENQDVRRTAAWALREMGEPAYAAVKGLEQYFTTQSQYEEVVRLYMYKQYGRAKPLLMQLLESSPEERLYDRFKVGPAVLELLGRIYLAEQNIPAAMDCFQKMVERYFYDEYDLGPEDLIGGPSNLGGPAGAEGMVYQLEVLTDSDELRYLAEDDEFATNPDYDAAIQLAHQLIQKFDGVPKPLWEGGINYEEVGAYTIMTCLEEKKAPLKTWEEEIRKVIGMTKNKYLSADLLLTLGGKHAQLGQIPHAVKIYEEVISQYAELYFVEGSEGGTLRVYSLEAFEKLLGIYENQDNAETQRQKVKAEMKNQYQKILQRLKAEENSTWMLEQLEDRFGKYVK